MLLREQDHQNSSEEQPLPPEESEQVLLARSHTREYMIKPLSCEFVDVVLEQCL